MSQGLSSQRSEDSFQGRYALRRFMTASLPFIVRIKHHVNCETLDKIVCPQASGKAASRVF